MKAMPALPLVSVIIPTYNRVEFVQQAIDSVLAQTYWDYELIVVDDGSTDGTGDALKARYGDKIIYLWQENKGGPTARNLGLSAAKGQYIAFLDSDDFWLPEKLTRQVPILDNDPSVDIVICQIWHVNIDGQKLSEQPLGGNMKPSDFKLENLLISNKIAGGASTCLIRRSALNKVGGFSQDIRFGAEWDLWLRMAANSAVLSIIPEPLAFYRQHKITLTFLPDIQYVDRTLADRLSMLERCITSFPKKISLQLYNRALAHQYVRAGLGSFFVHESEKGKMRLAKGLELYPDFWKTKDAFADQVSVFALSYSFDQQGKFSAPLATSFVNLLCANLPEALNQRDRIQLTQGYVRREVGFRQYKDGERVSGLRQILSAVLWSPQMLDLAVVAVFAELVLGQKTVNVLRSIRHRDSEE